jgi:flagella basal body P-ring formation protein FlgA
MGISVQKSTNYWQAFVPPQALRLPQALCLPRALGQLTALCLLLVFAQAAHAASGETPQFPTPKMSVDEIQALAVNHAKQHYSKEPAGNSRVEITAGKMDSRLALHRCSQPIELTMQSASTRASRTLVKTRCNGDKPWAIFVPLNIETWQTVVTTTRPLKRDEEIMPDDVALREMQLNQSADHYLTSINHAIGKLASRNIKNNTALSNRQLRIPKLVKRGDEVVIVTNSGAISVRMMGEALADGKKGEQIAVRNLRSTRIIKARVVERGKVRVDS